MSFMKKTKSNETSRMVGVSLFFAMTLAVLPASIAEPFTEQYVNQRLAELASEISEAVFSAQYLPREYNPSGMATFMVEYIMTHESKPIFIGVYGETDSELFANAVEVTAQGLMKNYRGPVSSWPNVTIVYFSNSVPGQALEIAAGDAGMQLLIEKSRNKD